MRLAQKLVDWWHYGRTQRYLVWTVISLCLNFALCTLFVELLAIPEEYAFAMSLAVVFFCNFLGCRYYIFNDSNISFKKQFVGFFISSIGFRVSEYIAFYLCVTMLNFNYQLVLIGVTGVSFVFKQIVTRLFVFPKTPT